MADESEERDLRGRTKRVCEPCKGDLGRRNLTKEAESRDGGVVRIIDYVRSGDDSNNNNDDNNNSNNIMGGLECAIGAITSVGERQRRLSKRQDSTTATN